MRRARDLGAKLRYVYDAEGAAGVYHRVRGKLSRQTGFTPVTLPTDPVGDVSHRTWPTSVVILANQALPQCFHYRVRQKQYLLEQLGVACTVVDPDDAPAAVSAVQLASLVIVFRLPLSAGVRQSMAQAQRLGARVVFEVDDAVYRRDLIERNQNVLSLPKSVQRAVIVGADEYLETMRTADACLASTQALAEDMARVSGKPAMHVENGIDPDMVKVAAGIDADPRPSRREGLWITYGSGSTAHDEDFALAAPGLAQVMAADPEVGLKLIGPVGLPAPLQGFADRVWRLDALPYGEYLRELADSDLTIAPLADDAFNNFKSQVKVLEAGLLGVPLVASRTLYDRYVEDGVSGVLCSPAQWPQALTQVVGDEPFRKQLGTAGRESVRRWFLDEDPLTQMRAVLQAYAGAVR